ncbi:hypothetical protein CGCF415_v003226 [Colletotrichum fructicola]|uniref:Uncharacterized protein n=1 Tax=Colletotrichum fructicola (strain Nara gc5) TaxID=1213859 RepID=A0A7J6JN22_COLFN|nr:hypothetical protein CGGC5_v002314 [Colletotrichum fructicola Nara gc5]KAF4895173.1 hypothetical protein CGCFRS4_v006155 [Colletotrichum fructicola]KAF4913076.1 hypothetical protein CGCF415_v003226 [Colletotrichum fructicola]KAF4941108.1 hypothetical protein CGCF245_v002023 [Colletotrichum fructicola]
MNDNRRNGSTSFRLRLLFCITLSDAIVAFPSFAIHTTDTLRHTHTFPHKNCKNKRTHTHTHVSSGPDIDRYVVSSSLRPASLDLRRREKLLFSLFSLALQHVIPSHLLRLSPDPDRRLLEARQKVSVKGAAAAAVLCCWATSSNRHLQQQQQQQRQMRVRMQAHDLGG